VDPRDISLAAARRVPHSTVQTLGGGGADGSGGCGTRNAGNSTGSRRRTSNANSPAQAGLFVVRRVGRGGPGRRRRWRDPVLHRPRSAGRVRLTAPRWA
jgi:hypothetical protein